MSWVAADMCASARLYPPLTRCIACSCQFESLQCHRNTVPRCRRFPFVVGDTIPPVSYVATLDNDADKLCAFSCSRVSQLRLLSLFRRVSVRTEVESSIVFIIDKNGSAQNALSSAIFTARIYGCRCQHGRADRQHLPTRLRVRLPRGGNRVGPVWRKERSRLRTDKAAAGSDQQDQSKSADLKKDA